MGGFMGCRLKVGKSQNIEHVIQLLYNTFPVWTFGANSVWTNTKKPKPDTQYVYYSMYITRLQYLQPCITDFDCVATVH